MHGVNMKIMNLYIEFQKTITQKLNENPSSGRLVVPCEKMDRQTNMTDEANNQFLQFCDHA
jgi:hypothetical protein